MTIGKVENVQI